MIPDKIKRLNSQQGYFDAFYELLADNPGITNKQAWLMIEEIYEEWYGLNRYASYASFRNAKHRYFDVLARRAMQKRSAAV